MSTVEEGTCPACGSDDPAVCASGRIFDPHRHDGRPCCPHPWHSTVQTRSLVACPTCGSDNPSGMLTGTPANPDRERCSDRFHASAFGIQEADRCSECGGRIKGFVANFIRRCPNDWHVIREELFGGLAYRDSEAS